MLTNSPSNILQPLYVCLCETVKKTLALAYYLAKTIPEVSI